MNKSEANRQDLQAEIEWHDSFFEKPK